MDTFQKEYRGNVVVITVNLVSATLNDTNEFKAFMDELILMTECDVVVDLAACNHLDSTFIGALVMNFKKLKEKNRFMVLVEPNDQTKVFLTMNSLSKIFPLYPSVEVAVEDLLNRNMLEKNLTNQNHSVTVKEQTDEINDADTKSEETVNTLAENADTENINELNLQETVNQDVNESIQETADQNLSEPVMSEQLENSEVGINENLTNELNNLEKNENEELNKNISNDTVVETVIAEKTDSDDDEPEKPNEQLVEEFADGERDYRQGTIAWDFGE
ncbi:MAG: STAS domain-containing protein [Ignavibacteria bacterium]|nr:STAS domain-containing protein [Ignavibacteria bacterium]